VDQFYPPMEHFRARCFDRITFKFKGVTADDLKHLSSRIKMDSSPGPTWNSLGCRENKDVFESHPNLLLGIINEKIRLRLSLTIDDCKIATPVELFSSGVADPVKCFIKKEATKISKGDRKRIINNPPLDELLIELLLYGEVMLHEVANWENIPSKPGMGLDPFGLEGLRASVPDEFIELNSESKSSDVSGWDWGARLWLALMGVESLRREMGVPIGSDFHHLMIIGEYLSFRKIILLSDGSAITMDGDVGLTTGRILTACLNSRMRFILAVLCGALYAITMGDDCREWVRFWSVRLENYLAYGFRVEAAELPPDVEFEFCSMHFLYNGHYYNLNHEKQFYNLLTKKPDLVLANQFQYELRYNPELPDYIAFLSETEWAPMFA
jgi:hypothetical protein